MRQVPMEYACNFPLLTAATNMCILFCTCYTTAHKGHLRIVKYFHSMGGIIDQQATDGCTALQAAAEQDHTHIMEYLLEHSQDKVGTATAALTAAARHGHLEGSAKVLA
jgi:ankyrin repeat protein